MEQLNRLIEKWEQRRALFKDSPFSLTALDECISDLKAAMVGEQSKYPPTSLDSKCHFKKHQGKLWKEVIETDPDYVDWCLKNISTFSLDQDAHNYLIDIQNNQP
jgi:hypothetical protein